jgi:demethylmenaquinone methyltransferase/2-methoxy-6-polyprenyl-1,4-benzoquinol methylase
MRSIIQALQLPPASHGLDVGCGIGLQTLLLAEAVGPAGHITGVDILPELLRHADDLVVKAGLSGRIKYQEADMSRLPFAGATFDWVWSADCAGYPAGELQPLLRELMRVVRPGGSIILLAWSSQQVLPGYPLLEARLNATCSSYMPFLQGKSPDLHFMRAANSFQEAGLDQVEARTFIGNIQAPLLVEQRTALASLFEMLWGQKQPECSLEDWKEYQRLCAPGSADFILNLPDYYAFFTYTLFRGMVAS